jgi:hypothetical protein
MFMEQRVHHPLFHFFMATYEISPLIVLNTDFEETDCLCGLYGFALLISSLIKDVTIQVINQDKFKLYILRRTNRNQDAPLCASLQSFQESHSGRAKRHVNTWYAGLFSLK